MSIDHVILTKAAQEMEIPLTVIRKGQIINEVTNPDKLFTALQEISHSNDILTRKVKSWKRLAILACVATGYLAVRNHKLKKMVGVWDNFKKDFEDVLEDDSLFDEDLEENDI